MLPRDHTARILFAACIACAALHAQVAITGRVVDENGAAVGGARVEWRTADGGIVTASSDQAGNFRASLPAEGEYALRAERPGFFVFTNSRQAFETGPQQLTIRLNHLQEFADKIDVTYSPPAIDPALRMASIRSRPRSARNWPIRRSRACRTRRRRIIATRCRCSMAWWRTARAGSTSTVVTPPRRTIRWTGSISPTR